MDGALIVLLVIVVAIVLIKISKKASFAEIDYPYQGAGPLFTPAERSFYGVLDKIVGANAKIFGKVRVADMVMPKKGLSRSEWQKAFNKISAKHFDFVLCKNNDLSVICAIELNDSSHKSKNRQKRDELLSGVCIAAQIPLIQVPAKNGYAMDDVRELLVPYLNTSMVTPEQKQATSKNSILNEKLCPICASSMVIRVAQKGSDAGKKFWACSSYPKCKHVEAIN